MNNHLIKLKRIVAAAGVLASVAFYMAEYGRSDKNGEIAAFGGNDSGSWNADDRIETDSKNAEADSFPADEKGIDHDADKVSAETEAETFSEPQKEEIRSIVAEAVREELYAISSEGYLENALKEAAVLAASEAEAKKDMVNINTAGVSELMELDGIGEKRAADIVEYRDSAGRFSDIEELMNVSGIKQAAFDKIKDKIYV